MRPEEHVLYRFFDDKARLLYVGITNNPEMRFREHRANRPWWPQAAAITLTRYASRAALMAAEIEAIRIERPRYNVTHSEQAPPQQMRVHIHSQAQSLWPDASRFGNEPPPAPVPQRKMVLRMPLPCPECHSPDVFKGLDRDGGVVDDLVRCPNCLNIWLDEEWHAANGPSV